MRLTFQVSVELDSEWLLAKAQYLQIHSEESTGVLAGSVVRRMSGELENALSDAVIHKDGIVAGSVRVVRSEE